MVKWLMAIVASVTLASGCAAADGKLVITKDVQSGFDEYRAWLTSIGTGAYAVTDDGKGGIGAGCPNGLCYTAAAAAKKAISDCERLSGKKCVLFARNREAVIPYEIAP